MATYTASPGSSEKLGEHSQQLSVLGQERVREKGALAHEERGIFRDPRVLDVRRRQAHETVDQRVVQRGMLAKNQISAGGWQ